jgi:hypothetical protein
MQPVRSHLWLPRRAGILSAGVAVYLACTTLPLAAQAPQATITAITLGDTALQLTTSVLRTPFASVIREPAKVGTELTVDDELRSESDAAVVELGCKEGARVVLTGAFRVLVQPAIPPVECVFRLSSGKVDVQSEKPAGVEFGEVTLGVVHTQYSVIIAGPRAAAPSRIVVFDGALSVRIAGREVRGLGAGDGAAVRPDRLVRAPQTRDDIGQTALVFARMDVAQSGPTTPESAAMARSRLALAYASVLAVPTDAQRRVQLIATQLDLGVRPTATLYQLRRASPVSADTTARAKVTFLTGIAYSRIGDSARATTEFENAVRLDSAAVRTLIAQFSRLESPVYRNVLRRVRPIRRDSIAPSPAPRP